MADKVDSKPAQKRGIPKTGEDAVPTMLYIRMEGRKEEIEVTARANILSEDGKLDRNKVLRLGRVTDSPDFFEYLDGNKVVARAVRGDKAWTVTYPRLGKDKDVTHDIERTATKRSRSKKSTAPAKIDPGSDLAKVTAFVTGELYPAMKTKSGGGGQARQTQRSTMLKLIEEIAELTGRTPEEVAQEQGISYSSLAPKQQAEPEE